MTDDDNAMFDDVIKTGALIDWNWRDRSFTKSEVKFSRYKHSKMFKNLKNIFVEDTFYRFR